MADSLVYTQEIHSALLHHLSTASEFCDAHRCGFAKAIESDGFLQSAIVDLGSETSVLDEANEHLRSAIQQPINDVNDIETYLRDLADALKTADDRHAERAKNRRVN